MVLKGLPLIYNLTKSPSSPFLQFIKTSYCILPPPGSSGKFIAGLSGRHRAKFSPPLLLCWRDWEWQLCGGRVGIVFLPPCHRPPGWSAAGAAIRWVRGHTVVLFWEKGLLCCQVAVVGGDSYGFVFPPRVTASAASQTPPAPTPAPT